MVLSRFSRSECHVAARYLQHYLDGEIDVDRAVTVAEHLETCRRCGLEARAYESIKIAIGAAGPHRADDDAVARLRGFAERLSQRPD